MLPCYEPFFGNYIFALISQTFSGNRSKTVRFWQESVVVRRTSQVGGGGGGGGEGPCSLVPNKIFLVFPCSLKVFFRFWCSLFPKMSEL